MTKEEDVVEQVEETGGWLMYRQDDCRSSAVAGMEGERLEGVDDAKGGGGIESGSARGKMVSNEEEK